MAGKPRPFNANDIISLRNEGFSYPQISKKLSIPLSRVNKVIVASPSYKSVDKRGSYQKHTTEVIDMFNNDRSVKSIALQLNCSRGAISRILKANGINPRNRSESMYTRMAQTDEKGRKELTQSAHKAIRSMDRSVFVDWSIKQALTKGKTLSKVGEYELFVFEQLKIKGFNPIQQAPIHVYNIDILCGDTVIEVHQESSIPHNRPAYLKRIKYLLKSGFNVFYIKWSKRTPVNSAAIDELVSFINHTSFDPSASRKYRVIRGTGELFFSGSMNGDNFSIIKTSDSLLYS